MRRKLVRYACSQTCTIENINYLITMDEHQINLNAFAEAVIQLKKQALEHLSKSDYTHLKKIIWTNRVFLIIGYATAWIIPNPISMICIAIALTGMWTMVAHQVCHGGYNQVPSVPNRYKEAVFATKWRRFIDWPDWIYPPAWQYEHNTLHHFSLNEKGDPNQMSYRLKVLGLDHLYSKPKWLALLIVALDAAIWKIRYYAPNTLKAQTEKKEFSQDTRFKNYYLKTFKFCYIPYFIFQYVLVPLPFLCISLSAYIFVILNLVGAEILTNWYTFMLIAPNHTGMDLLLHEDHFKDKGEFYLAQILSTCDYKTGGYWNDYFHGYMNYQIEHHLFPDLPLSQYVLLQPKVKALCGKYGIPYIQESLWVRFKKFFDVLVGKGDMRVGKPVVDFEA